jgi:hypothetical protein
LVVQGRSSNHQHLYGIGEVIQTVRNYLQRPRIKLHSRQLLEQVLQTLLNQLGNIVSVPFGAGEVSELGRMTQELTRSMAQTDQVLSNLKAKAADIKGKYHIS